MYILANMWFTKLIKQFFFWIDKIVYNFISSIYDLLITIARTSVLTQADIADMADRIYKLLAIFMIFKVTLSLITYVVNPDDFSDKSKGVAKLGTNIVISLAMLVLTPYIFNYAYQFQTIILEDNSLATLVFGSKKEEETSFFNTAGDDMAYITMSAFISPNLSLGDIHECSILIDSDTKKFNEVCKEALTEQTSDQNFKEQTLKNYIGGVENSNLELLFRQDLVLATDEDNEEFIMDYKFIFSTVVGVVIILLLITFCMDVAVRSIKLAFLQLIAPIPILSYVDPKSGKDGLFKKWYEMCLKTFISLFVRLLALYFAVYIISKVADMRVVDLVDGSYQTNALVAIFIIIGALMFAKQLPKILEGLGIKLDGDGKFFLNPFKKFEEEAIGGKRITGAAGGAVAGLIGGKGNPFRAISGAARGFVGNKGYAGGLAAQADVNRKIREAKISGAGFLGSRAAVLSSRYGLDDADLEGRATNLRKDKRAVEEARRRVDAKTKSLEIEKKGNQDKIKGFKKSVGTQEVVKDKISKMEERARAEIEKGNGGEIAKRYQAKKARLDQLEKHGVAQIAIMNDKNEITGYRDATAAEISSGNVARYRKATDNEIVMAHEEMNAQLDTATYEYISKMAEKDGKFSNGKDDASLKTMYWEYTKAVEDAKNENVKIYDRESGQETEFEILSEGKELHAQMGKIKGSVSYIQTTEINPVESRNKDIDDEIREVQVSEPVIISKGKDTDGKVSLEEAERIIKVREQELKDEQDQRKLNRGLAKDRSFTNGSGK